MLGKYNANCGKKSIILILNDFFQEQQFEYELCVGISLQNWHNVEVKNYTYRGSNTFWYV